MPRPSPRHGRAPRNERTGVLASTRSRVDADSIAGRLPRIAALVVTLSVVVVAGCSGNTATPRSAAVRSREHDFVRAPAAAHGIRDAYVEFWDGVFRAADPPDPTDPILAETATGAALAWARSLLGGNQYGGVARRGSVDFGVDVLRSDGSTAVVRDCYHSEWLSYALPGNRLGQPAGTPLDSSFPHRSLRTATLSRIHGSWKVASIEPPEFELQRSCGTLEEERAVTDAYRRYEAVLHDVFASGDPDPNDARLATVAAGSRGLDFLRNTIRDDASRGLRRRWATPGAIGRAELTAFESGRGALVLSCNRDDGTLSDLRTGNVLSSPGTSRKSVTASLVQVDGTWKVTGTQEGSPCELAK